MKVYLTRKCSDMTEGKGGMVPDKCFLNRKHAAEYIDSKPGVMGRRKKWSEEKYGDWNIQEIDVLEYSFIESEKLRKQTIKDALGKLTDEEIDLLGIDVKRLKR